MKLVVTQPFADYKVGDPITDTAKVEEVLESHPGSVVKTADDPEPEQSEVQTTEVITTTNRARR